MDPAIAKQTTEPPLLAEYIRQVADQEPDAICFSIFRTNQPKDGYIDITFRQLRAAIDFCCDWLEKSLVRERTLQTIAYIGPQDCRYLILAIAAAETGWKLFVPSPRNSIEAQLKLLAGLKCDVFLYGADFPAALSIIEGIKAHCSLTVLPIPDQPAFFAPDRLSVEPRESSKTFDTARFEPLLVFHTSGTTGFPKPVIIPQGAIALTHSFATLSSKGGERSYLDYWTGLRGFFPFPLFHSAGMTCVIGALYYRYIVLFAPSAPPSADLFKEVLEMEGVQATAIPPSLLVDMSKDPECLEALGQVKYVLTGGGPLAQHAGDAISSKAWVISGFGTTESCLLPNGMPDPEDWAYLKFHPYLGIQMRPHSNGLFESVFVKKEELKYYQPVFIVFPQLAQYSTNDLWSKHPTKEGLWKHEARVDDVIVYSTGEKFNPATMEGAIGSHPKVSAALVLGHGRFQSVALIEAHSEDDTKTKEAQNEFLEEVWPYIEKANQSCPAYAQIKKDFVIVIDPKNPMPRAGKGTVQRQPTESMFKTIIDAAYQDNEAVVSRRGSLVVNGEAKDIDKTVLHAIAEVIGVQDFLPDDNIFDRGCDSLGARTLARALNTAFQASNAYTSSITQKVVYAHPTARSLAAHIKGMKQSGDDTKKSLDELYVKYTIDLPINARLPKAPQTGRVILLTGSTGSFGSYLLDQLLATKQVSKVYCLNRGQDSELRQKAASESRGLDAEFPSQRVEFLDSAPLSATSEYLGLSAARYRALLGDVTDIIHNAWQVDFNLALANYADTHVHRVRQLINFSSQSRHGAVIHFISTIGTVSNFPDGHVPEKIFSSTEYPEAAGYAGSKFVAERMLALANEVSNVPANIYRVGQIAGPSARSGMWNRDEWFPLIVRSARALGALPSTLGPYESVDWMPVDQAAQAMVQLALHRSEAGSEGRPEGHAQVYHLVNPRKVAYASVLPTIADHLQLPAVPFAEWVSRLAGLVPSGPASAEREAAAAQDAPALKLLEFFQALVDADARGRTQVLLDTTRAQRDSAALRGMGPVTGDLVVNWLRQWGL